MPVVAAAAGAAAAAPAGAVPAVVPAAAAAPVITVNQQMKDMFVRLREVIATANAIIDSQKIDHPATLTRMTAKRAHNMVLAVRNPGGSGVGSRGKLLPEEVENNIFCAAAAIDLRMRTDHPVDVATIQLDEEIWAAGAHRVKDDTHVNREVALSPLTGGELKRDFFTIMEDFDRNVEDIRGEGTNDPLGKLLCSGLIPLPSADNPPSNYVNIDDQLVERGLIIAPGFVALDVAVLERAGFRKKTGPANTDNAHLHRLIKDHFGKTSLYVPAMRTNSTLDGRLALILMKENKEGNTAIETRNTENRERIMAIRWTQDTRTYMIEKALDEHVLCHTVQADIARLHSLADFTDREKVHWVLASINNPAYNQTLLQIESEGPFGARHDFDKACLLLREHQRLLKSQKSRNVSEMGSGNGNGNGGDGRGGRNRGAHNRNNHNGRAHGGGGGGGKIKKRPSQNERKRDNTRGGRSLDKATREDGEWNLKGIREGDFDDLARKQSHITKPHYSPEEFN